jgi:glycosyltransferase involved in cell wall biosynthesis
LRQALQALCDQTLDRDRYEVVLVDDGSTDGTRQVAASFNADLPIRYAYQAHAGLASAKNHALALARAPIVVFVDDDDVLAADALEAHHRAHEEHPDPRAAVLGHTGLAPDVARSPLMGFVTEIGCQLFYYPGLKHGDRLDFTFFWGGRSSCKRELLMEYGVFNPVFAFGCEDIELGYRLSRAGFHVVYDSRARSTMIRTLDFDGFCRRSYAQGWSNWTFASMHPADVIRHWAGVRDVARWERIKPRFDDVLNVGRALDRIAHDRVTAGLDLDDAAIALLHRAYFAAFTACRIRGSADCRARTPVVLP